MHLHTMIVSYIFPFTRDSINESCHTHESVMSHVWTSYVTNIRIRRVAPVNESCHMCAHTQCGVQPGGAGPDTSALHLAGNNGVAVCACVAVYCCSVLQCLQCAVACVEFVAACSVLCRHICKSG